MSFVLAIGHTVMSETLVGVLQGIATGVGILAAGVGLFVASSTGGNFQVVVNERVVAFQPPARTLSAEATPGPVETAPAPQQSEPVLPTNTPVPQADPLPPPVENGYRADRSYFNETAADLSLLVVSLKRLAILLATPLPDNDGWRAEIGIVIGAVRQGADNLARVEPSEASIELHSFLMSATSRCNRVALALDGELTRLPIETFQLIGDTLTGCTGDVVSVLQSIN